MNKPKVAKTKIRKKIWVRILAPRSFNQMLLGETYVYEPRAVLGRAITVNLMTLTKDPKKQSINLKFVATELSNDDVLTEVIGYEVSQSTIKRLVRRGKNRIDDSFVVATSDKKNVAIKPFMISITKTKSSIQTSLRHAAKRIIIDEVGKLTFENLIFDVISFKLQKVVKDALKTVYPVKTFEIREVSLEREGAKVAKKPQLKIREKEDDEDYTEEPEKVQADEIFEEKAEDVADEDLPEDIPSTDDVPEEDKA